MAETLLLSIHDEAAADTPLLTIPGGLGIYRKRVALDLSIAEGAGIVAEARFEGCVFRISSNGDSFLDQLLPGSQDTESFDLIFHWDEKGFSFGGSGMLEITLPVHGQLPFIRLSALHLIARPDLGGDSHVSIELSADLSGSFLGIIGTTVERLGVTADFFLAPENHPEATQLGPVAALARFKGPTGVGLSLDIAGVLEGAGFLSVDPDRGRYAGALSVNLLGIGVTVIAIINTRPDFSFLGIVTANFGAAGIDIGFGFTINAVGGLFGLGRGVDLHALSEAVRNNSLSSLLFPANPVEDAPRIINDLDRVFPLAPDHFLVGPMFELGWGKPTGMFTLSLGVVLEIPDPKIAIIGIMKVLVPPIEDDALLRIQVNFVGSIDFGQSFLRFDASLYDSRLILYTLEGDMAARLRWGDHAGFAITVGGFHPRYVAAADLDIGTLKRVTINLLPTSDNPRLRILSYYAVTSNSLQHGARIELYAEAAGFGIQGFLGYDLLAQVNPLYFEAGFGGSVSVLAGGEEILSITLSLQLSGPTPWHIDGEASFKVLIVRIHIPVHATFGDEDAPALPDVDVAAKFREQLGNVRNWSATLPDQSQFLVMLRPDLAVGKDEILAHPAATIQFNQNTVPLKLTIQRFFAGKPKNENHFDITGLAVPRPDDPALSDPLAIDPPLKSEFAPAQYFELSNDDKMSAPAFKELDSGIRANGAALVRVGGPEPRDYRYRDTIFDSAAQDSPFLEKVARIKLAGVAAIAGLGGSAVAQSALYRERVNARPTGDEIKVSTGGYRIVDGATMQPVVSGALDSHIAAKQTLGAMVAANPSLGSKLVVISEHELG
jgi:hypothetical protein